MVNPELHFASVVPGFMAKLLRDFPEIDVLDAASVFGNLGHESKGLTDDQEDKPLAGRGGRNWPQWTGTRRRAFEAYCKRNGLDPDSDKAAYKYLFVELRGIEGSEKNALPKTVAAVGLEAKVRAFEQGFLRAHPDYKHYPSRLAWAERALAAWERSAKMFTPDPFGERVEIGEVPKAKPVPIPRPAPAPTPQTGDGNGHAVTLITVAAAVALLAIVALVVWYIGIRR